MNTDISMAVATQVIIMAIYIAIGFLLTKINFLSRNGTKQMSDLLINIVTPCVIIMAFQDGFTADSTMDFFYALALSISIHIIAIALISAMYSAIKNKENVQINKFSCVYSNCGFMGIPLLNATLGAKGVFIGSAYLAVFNVLAWTHGYNLFNGGKDKVSLKKILINPGVTGIFISAILIILNIKLPQVINSSISGIAALNTPVAMILLGVYLGESKILNSLKKISIYIVSFMRLIFIPLMAIIVFKLLNIDSEIAITVILSSACPCAAIAAILASQSGNDSGYASSLVSISTIFSLITLPLMAHLASIILYS